MASNVIITMVKCSACQLPNRDFEDISKLQEQIESAHNT